MQLSNNMLLIIIAIISKGILVRRIELLDSYFKQMQESFIGLKDLVDFC